jgi:hypothetical protein
VTIGIEEMDQRTSGVRPLANYGFALRFIGLVNLQRKLCISAARPHGRGLREYFVKKMWEPFTHFTALIMLP